MRAIGWDEPASIALLALFGLGGVLLLVFTGLAVLVVRSPSLPIAVLIAFLVGGAQLPAGSAGAELSAVILGVSLAGNVTTVGLSVGGLLAGILLVFLGDRLLRQVRHARH